MKKILWLMFMVSAAGIARGQSVRIDVPEFGYVYTKAKQEPFFTRSKGDANLQEFISEFYIKRKLIPPDFKSLVILTIIIDKKGVAFFSKAYTTDSKVDLAPLQLKKCVEQMPPWLPASNDNENVVFQVLLSLRFEDSQVAVRRLKF